jgi:hypothetical protein
VAAGRRAQRERAAASHAALKARREAAKLKLEQEAYSALAAGMEFPWEETEKQNSEAATAKNASPPVRKWLEFAKKYARRRRIFSPKVLDEEYIILFSEGARDVKEKPELNESF